MHILNTFDSTGIEAYSFLCEKTSAPTDFSGEKWAFLGMKFEVEDEAEIQQITNDTNVLIDGFAMK